MRRYIARWRSGVRYIGEVAEAPAIVFSVLSVSSVVNSALFWLLSAPLFLMENP
jgi:hypothetical protein